MKTLINELKRHWPGIAVIAASLFVFGDMAQLAVQLYNLSMVALVLIFSHLFRKAMFPYIDLEKHISMSRRSPIASSIVVLALAFVLTAILNAAGVK